MKLKLNNNTELNTIQVNGASRYFQGQNRDSLEFVFAEGEYSFAELDELFAEKKNTKRLTIVSDDQNESVYEDYSLRVSMEMKPITITSATPEHQEVTEERVMVTMAQLTYLEKQLENQQAQIDTILVAMLEV